MSLYSINLRGVWFDRSGGTLMTRFVSKRLLVTVLLFLLCSLLASSQTPTNTTVYVYDELGRLKAVITSSGEAAVYSYDAAGNITSITRRTAGEVSIIQFTPDSGSIGTSVTIYGTGFSTDANQNMIQFNGVSAVPELSTWAMMLIGFGLFGFVAYRRKSKRSPAVA